MAKLTAHPASQRHIDRGTCSLRAMRAGFQVLRRLSRPAAVAVLTRLFVTPRRHAAPPREREVLALGAHEWVTFRGRSVALWRFPPVPADPPADAPARMERPGEGHAPPVVLLVHGWEGRGSQLGAFVAPLRASGFEVALFDHIGHGASEGKRCSLIAMRDTVEALARHLGAARIAGVVAHSMGTAATSLAADAGAFTGGPAWPRCVYVAPPYDLVRYFGHYLELVVGDRDLLPDMLRRMERRFGAKVEDLHYDNVLPRRNEPLLVLHSTDDLDVSEEAGRAVAARWPGAVFEPYTGLGHRRILRDAAVVARGVAFLAPAALPAEPR